MIAELNAAFQSLNVLNNWVQAHRSMRNFNELAGAVAEVNAKLLAVQSVALDAQEKQATFTERIRTMEAEITQLKNWDRERERYELAGIALGKFTFRLKPGMEHGEPPHDLCPNCFTKGEKAILQFETYPSKKFYCQRCKTTVILES